MPDSTLLRRLHEQLTLLGAAGPIPVAPPVKAALEIITQILEGPEDVNGLQTEVDNIKASIAQLENFVKSRTEDINSIRAELSQLRALLDELLQRVQIDNKEITTLKEEVLTLENRLTILEQRGPV